MQNSNEEKSIIEGVKEFLKRNLDNPNFKWVCGAKTFTAKTLLEELDKNNELKEFIIKAISKYAVEELTKVK